MDEKDTNQKTIVAFIAGLLIGGLLVWVFGSASEDAPMSDNGSDTETSEGIDSNTDGEGDGDSSNSDNNTTGGGGAERPVVTGSGSIAVLDQAAGSVVVLGEIEYPTTNGWIVIHEDAGGALGNALGASRYSTENGLIPTQVELLRNTEAGNAYHAVLYSENGDRVFDLNDDAPISNNGSMIEAVFTAN